MRDFTLQIYTKLLRTALQNGYKFITFEQYCKEKEQKENYIILRHDVDLKAYNSLQTAKIEAKLGIAASYYFRVVPQSDKPAIIEAIAALGHEIGYHYEDMSIFSGNSELAIKHFEEKLAYFRSYYPVSTICMHGAPASKHDGKELWKRYKYTDYGIIGEPYFDADFSTMLYLTDTGRRWDGYNVSVRDKIPKYQDQWTEQGLTFSTTSDVIEGIESGKISCNIMITTHPQRWTDNTMEWWKELLIQRLKNSIKYLLIKWRK